jgi:hypothetical protein
MPGTTPLLLFSIQRARWCWATLGTGPRFEGIWADGVVADGSVGKMQYADGGRYEGASRSGLTPTVVLGYVSPGLRASRA